MFNFKLKNSLILLSNLGVNMMNEGICFFLFHQPKFPDKARKVRNGENCKNNSKICFERK